MLALAEIDRKAGDVQTSTRYTLYSILDRSYLRMLFCYLMEPDINGQTIAVRKLTGAETTRS